MPEERESERICLFGGTFDPVHIAHLKIANEALKRFTLSRVLFVPSAIPPHKDASAVTPYEDRYRMLEIACAPYPCFIASRLEAGSETNYTIDTLDRFRPSLKPEDQLFFLIGADAFDEIKTWKRWQDVITQIEFIAVSRPGRTYDVPEGARVHPLDGLELPVSSSTIRARLVAGEQVAEVPAEVREYIEQRGLYGTAKATASL